MAERTRKELNEDLAELRADVRMFADPRCLVDNRRAKREAAKTEIRALIKVRDAAPKN